MNKSVMTCCICNNENIGQFITINNKKYHLCCIEQLQQENKKLNSTIQTYDILLKANFEENKRIKENYDRIYNENCKLREEHNINDISLLDENQKLKDNWNELKRWLYEEHYLYVPEIARNSTYQKVLEKMYEIEKEN